MRMPELATIVAETLRSAGVDTIFGVPGGGNNLDVIGAAESAGIRFVLAHTESAAAIMGGTYAELTGNPSACIATRGPGAANVANGVAQALLDRQSLIVLTDSVGIDQQARINHQRLDQLALFSGITKWSGTLGCTDTASTLKEAIGAAVSLPRGPVHLDLDPNSTSSGSFHFEHQGRGGAEMEDSMHGLRGSSRPMILLGLGARQHTQSVRDFIVGTNIPVLCTYKAKGIIPDDWANFAGLLTGAQIEREALRAADLFLAIGLDPVELLPTEWGFETPVVSISEWPSETTYFGQSQEVIGELGETLRRVRPSINEVWDPEWARNIRLKMLSDICHEDSGLSPQQVVSQARHAYPPGSIATVDSGAHMLITMPLWSVDNPGEILISSGLATMGYALPASIAAAIANPGRRVVCFVGDGGLGMVLGELETVARYQLPITIVVFNDDTLTLIALKQRQDDQGGPGAVTYRHTDFATVARGFAIQASSVASIDELVLAYSDAQQQDGPYLVDVTIDPLLYKNAFAAVRGSG